MYTTCASCASRASCARPHVCIGFIVGNHGGKRWIAPMLSTGFSFRGLNAADASKRQICDWRCEIIQMRQEIACLRQEISELQ